MRVLCHAALVTILLAVFAADGNAQQHKDSDTGQPRGVFGDAQLESAMREAGSRAGLWQATLDQTQAQIFAPEQIRVILMNMKLIVFGREKPIQTKMTGVEFFLQAADSTPTGIRWFADYPVLNENRLHLNVRWWNGNPNPPRLTVDAEYSPTGDSIAGTIVWQGKSIAVKFVRPPAGNLPFEGEWATDESPNGGIFHIRSLGDGQYLAILDQVHEQSLFGIVFTGTGEKGRLSLRVKAANAHNSFNATLESGGKALQGEWRGSGFLTAPADFHRIDTLWHVPGHAPQAVRNPTDILNLVSYFQTIESCCVAQCSSGTTQATSENN